jgi:hypothetical protein
VLRLDRGQTEAIAKAEQRVVAAVYNARTDPQREKAAQALGAWCELGVSPIQWTRLLGSKTTSLPA